MNDVQVERAGVNSSARIRVLVLEDNPSDAELMVDALRQAGLDPDWERVDTEEDFRARLATGLDLILSDYALPQFTGIQALRLVRARGLDVPFILVSGSIGEDIAVEAMREGADDYLLKDRIARLGPATRQVLERNRLRAEKARVERVLAVLSGINSAIVRIHDRQKLFEEACRIAVEHGGFAMAWIGLLDPVTLDVTAVAWSGKDAERLARMKATARSDVPEGQGVMGRAIREKKAVFNNDIVAEDRLAGSRRQEALKRGYRSLIALPLLVNEEVIGNLSLYASDPNFYNEDEVKLLSELAGNISFALEDIARQQKLEKLSRIHSVLSAVNSAIVRIQDRQQLLQETCRIAAEHGRFGIAWIGTLDTKTLDVTPVAYAGLGAREFLGTLRSSASSGHPSGQGVVGRAFRERKPAFVNDIAAESGAGARRQEAVRHGYRSHIALPLLVDNDVARVIVLYARESGFFNEEELNLLNDLAGNVSLALKHLAGRQRVEKLSRVRDMSSAINSAIVQAPNPQALFEEACRIAVEQGRLGSAWIGMLDPATLDITPVAWAGEGSEEMRTIRSTARDDPPRGQGAVSRAVRERRAVFNNDLSLQTFGGPRRDTILKLGFQSMIALPLMEGDAVAGTLTLYAREAGLFDGDEITLLTELAGNVSFALGNMARQERLDKLSRIRAVSSSINAAIARIRDRQTLFEETCRIASEIGKFELVWIATIDAGKQEITPVAWTGFSPETARALTWATISDPRVTLNEVMRTRRPAVRNDLQADATAGTLRQEALRKGCRSTVCLPFVVDGEVVGAIILFAKGRGFFDEGELALLDELAADISLALQNIARQHQLDYLSYYDPLTGLPNRTLFIDRAGQQFQTRRDEPQTVALILINLERFRNVNESFGRHGGDELLKLVAQRLDSTFRGRDFLARIGADTFGAVIRGIRDAASAIHVVENQVLVCFREPYELNGRELRIAAKAGIAVFPADGGDADTLFKNAEVALRNAHHSGERYLFYAAEMNARAAQLLSLETRLRKAVDAQEFVLHYQPKIELASGALCGLEALIRWQAPGGGLVAPGAFIPMLEETGLILEVGRWALAQALAQYREWTARGCGVPRIAVNVSAIQLQQRDFTDMVIEVVQQQSDHPDALELEITESLLMKDMQASIRKLSILRGLGIHIAMDDFGTGHSSLSYLARLPINCLKIDRSFVNGMMAGPQEMAIITTIIALAHSLKLKVVAEGVETEAQAQTLASLNCDEAQGYLYSKPLPPADTASLLLAQGKSSAAACS